MLSKVISSKNDKFLSNKNIDQLISQSIILVAMRTFLASPPVSAFAMVMGLSGLSLSWSKFSHVSQLELAQDISLAFGLLAIVVFLALALGLLRKQLQTPEKVLEEWNHPVKSSFFGAISVSVCLLAAVIIPYSFQIAEIVW
uniref:SLAC1 family transporter n=1 Tax=Polynucleobacter sp. TaxID=2029855 RepID=UPI004048E1C9